MDPSQQGHGGRQNRTPNAAQLQAFANRQTAVAGQKRGSRRQLLMDELEDKDAQLYDAQMQIRELTEAVLTDTTYMTLLFRNRKVWHFRALSFIHLFFSNLPKAAIN